MKFILSLMLFSQIAFAKGGDTSGGGKGVICRDSNQKILHAELLDIWEGRALYGLEPKVLGGTIEEILDAIEKKIAALDGHQGPYGPHGVLYGVLIPGIQKNLHLLPPGTVLKPVDDADEIALPTGCNLEQIALYKDDTTGVVVNQDLWNAMDVLNKSALIVHEAVYRHEREFSDAKNSFRSRRITAHLFSGFEFTPVDAGIAEYNSVSCWTTSTTSTHMDRQYSFRYYWNTNDPQKARVNFDRIAGEDVFGQALGEVVGFPWPEHSPNPLRGYIIPHSTFENLGAVNVKGEAPAGSDIMAKFYLTGPDRIERRLRCGTNEKGFPQDSDSSNELPVGFYETKCVGDNCFSNGWKTTSAEGFSMTTLCKSGDCQKYGWTSTANDESTYDITCLGRGCFVSGWKSDFEIQYESGHMGFTDRISCRDSNCLAKGWDAEQGSIFNIFGGKVTCTNDDCSKYGGAATWGQRGAKTECLQGDCYKHGWDTTIY